MNFSDSEQSYLLLVENPEFRRKSESPICVTIGAVRETDWVYPVRICPYKLYTLHGVVVGKLDFSVTRMRQLFGQT